MNSFFSRIGYTSLDIVPVEDIPKEALDCPTDDFIGLLKLFSAMQFLCDRKKGIGLSAVQVGVPLKAFVVKYGNNYKFLINCEYHSLSDEKFISLEGCLSLVKNNKLRYFEVERFKKIKVIGKELRGLCVDDGEFRIEEMNMELDDFYSVVYQHEIEHHHNILISNIGKEVDIKKINCI